MKNNVLLIIVDCLRYDYVTEERMPLLTKWGREHVWFTNYWSTSHCTDPAITHMLSGRHPSTLRLYSMMYEHRDYSVPEGVEMLPQTAKKVGYQTAFITNIGRWYKRGVDHFIDCRMWLGKKIFGVAKSMVRMMTSPPPLATPWLMIVHTDDMHTNYTGGSYAAAAMAVDCYIDNLLSAVDEKNTAIFITADHGEGLGEEGIKQHGYGLWPFLTHVPLLMSIPSLGWRLHFEEDKGPKWAGWLADHGSLYNIMRSQIAAGLDFLSAGVPAVYQVGDTPPNIRHRGVVYPDGLQFIRETRGGILKYTSRLPHTEEWAKRDPEALLREHCAQYGIDYDTEEVDSTVEERLRALGYFE